MVERGSATVIHAGDQVRLIDALRAGIAVAFNVHKTTTVSQFGRSAAMELAAND